jgi:3-oxoacyl-[acyl-carrier protein] reductase
MVALVTGAGQGLGRAIAHALHAAGHRVAVTDVDTARAADVAGELDPQGTTAGAWTLDVRERRAFAEAADAAEERLGPIGILVNNAALTIARPVLEIDEDEWDEVLAVNLRGVLLGCQVLGPRMRDRGFGRIVNLSSLAGQQGGVVAGAHYAASKAGIIVLTKIVAKELAGAGVTVNAVAPAAIEGPQLAAVPPERQEAMRGAIPVGRFGQEHEVAALVTYLAGESAGYVTGATIDINGGLFMR